MDNLPVEFTDTCWLWTGSGDRYGVTSRGGITQTAHRYVYRLLVGEIPEGLQLDHLCEVKKCVNPAHLEPVTPLENLRRHYRKLEGHCPAGHKIDGYNAQAYTVKGVTRYRCRTCANIAQRANKRKLRAKL